MISPVDPASINQPAPPLPPRRSRVQRLLVSVGVAVALLALALVGLVLWGLYQFDQVEQFDVDLAEPEPGRALNYLLVGSDSRAFIDSDDPDAGVFLGGETGGMRSDTMLIARVDDDAGTVDLLSVPRDLWVRLATTPDDPGVIEQRINVAYEAGKPQRLVDTVEESLDIEINHYIEVDFRGFEGVIDTIGGVPMFFETALEDPGSGLSIQTPGCVVLDGQQSLAFVRARSLRIKTVDGWTTDGTGDLGRISRQQLFLQRALDRAAALDLSDALTLTRLVNQGSDFVSWDDSLDVGSMLQVMRDLADVGDDAVRTHSLPVAPFRTAGGAEVLSLDVAAAQDELNVFRGVAPEPTPATAPVSSTTTVLSPATVTVSVRNGTGIPGQAGMVSTGLGDAGFAIEAISDAPAAADRTSVRFAPGRLTEADLVARHLDPGADLVEDPAAGTAIIVTTGADFVAVRPAPVAAGPVQTDGSSAAESTSTVSVTAAPTTPAPTTTAVGYLPTGSACTP